MVVIDTSLLIDHLRCRTIGKASFLELYLQKNLDEDYAISTISIQELFQGESSRKEEEELAIFSLLSKLKELDYNVSIAIQAGKINRDSAYAINFPDSAIAATAIYHHASLLTLNVKDFQSIPSLKMV